MGYFRIQDTAEFGARSLGWSWNKAFRENACFKLRSLKHLT